jgi:membrane-bound ClpP family serine protease
MYFSSMELFFWGVVLLVVSILIIKSFFIRVQGGREGLVGKKASALAEFVRNGEVYEGKVICIGEIWSAKADFPVNKGENLVVSNSKGLVLFLNSKSEDENLCEKKCCM